MNITSLLQHHPQRPGRRDQHGFTIVELMIATTVLSVILLLVSVMMINLGRLYFKGINQARIQNNVRSTVDEIAQRLQFNGQNPQDGGSVTYGSGLPPVWATCIGNTRYTHVKTIQLGGADAGPFKHVLWRDTLRHAGSCPNTADLRENNPSSPVISPESNHDGTELIVPRSRIADFYISGTAPYEVILTAIYGDTDLLVNPNQPSAACAGGTGDQFCARASLKTTVGKRL